MLVRWASVSVSSYSMHVSPLVSGRELDYENLDAASMVSRAELGASHPPDQPECVVGPVVAGHDALV
jgi:hypothetical protein